MPAIGRALDALEASLSAQALVGYVVVPALACAACGGLRPLLPALLLGFPLALLAVSLRRPARR